LDIQKNGFTAEELASEKRVEAQRILEGRDNDFNLAGGIANNEKRMREGKRSNFEYWDEIQRSVQNLTLSELNAAAAKLVDTRQAVTVIAGDFKP
jgi:predicted Zn-dependent peptidase